ncbi:MAG: DEAD/DEAH box helicase, partial [Deltaproteobacteria bacterium]|nr:DEAD/DEAH box helicase [Deltaproteobacteria bacterium]
MTFDGGETSDRDRDGIVPKKDESDSHIQHSDKQKAGQALEDKIVRKDLSYEDLVHSERGQSGNGRETNDARAGVKGPRPDKPNILTTTRFTDFDLPDSIIEGLDASGFVFATPIQAQVIPEALKGRDIVGKANVGTGKTVAFLVPSMARLLAKAPQGQRLPRVLVIAPKRDEAGQIYTDGKNLSYYTGLNLSLIVSGVGFKEQVRNLEEGSDIVIGTPGRLLDYIHKKILNISAIEICIIEEADRLFDLGFQRDLKIILTRLAPFNQRQTMLFAANLSQPVLELVYQHMNPNHYITAEPDLGSSSKVVQELYHVTRQEKLPLLLGILSTEEHGRVIIFCNSKSTVDWLTKKLIGNGYHAEGISGELPQPRRLKIIQFFKDKQVDVLVTTDVGSRGILLEDVSHVINFDLPQDAENYVHRIGRTTGKEDKHGKAISFVCDEYVHHLEVIENILGEKIPVIFPPDSLFLEDHFSPKRFKESRGRSGKDRTFIKGPLVRPEYNKEGSEEPMGQGKGLASSPRPGGVFGLAPRQPVDSLHPDFRQVLSWKPSEVVSSPSELPFVKGNSVVNFTNDSPVNLKEEISESIPILSRSEEAQHSGTQNGFNEDPAAYQGQKTLGTQGALSREFKESRKRKRHRFRGGSYEDTIGTEEPWKLTADGASSHLEGEKYGEESSQKVTTEAPFSEELSSNAWDSLIIKPQTDISDSSALSETLGAQKASSEPFTTTALESQELEKAKGAEGAVLSEAYQDQSSSVPELTKIEEPKTKEPLAASSIGQPLLFYAQETDKASKGPQGVPLEPQAKGKKTKTTKARAAKKTKEEPRDKAQPVLPSDPQGLEPLEIAKPLEPEAKKPRAASKKATAQEAETTKKAAKVTGTKAKTTKAADTKTKATTADTTEKDAKAKAAKATKAAADTKAKATKAAAEIKAKATKEAADT